MTVARAIVLAVDPGKRGGWCVRTPTEWLSGTATKAAQRAQATTLAHVHSAAHDLPIVAVVEQWTAGSSAGRGGAGKRWNAASMIGTGSQRGRWLEALELAGIDRIVSAYPQSWRKVLGGLPRRTGAEAKASAVLVAKGLLKRVDVATDEAEAVCIALYASTSAEVAVMASKRVRARKAAT